MAETQPQPHIDTFSLNTWSSLGLAQSLTEHMEGKASLLSAAIDTYKISAAIYHRLLFLIRSRRIHDPHSHSESGRSCPAIWQRRVSHVSFMILHINPPFLNPPHIFCRRLVHAGTGTGKTLVYLAPILHYLQAMVPRMQRADGTCGKHHSTFLISLPCRVLRLILLICCPALILAPTRELCLQILSVATLLAKRFFWVVPGHVMGGENKNKEKARLRKGTSTPWVWCSLCRELAVVQGVHFPP